MVQRQSSRPTRLEDVAEAAGVHVSTVSRVLNGGSEAAVRPETRAADRGGGDASALPAPTRSPAVSSWRPPARSDCWCRRCATRSTRRSSAARSTAPGSADFVVLLAEDLGASSAQQAYERLVEEGRIDGLLIASARPGSPLFDHLVDDPIPCVFVNRRHLGSGRNAAMREEDAGRLAAEHLLGLGHTRLAHISGPRSSTRRAAAPRGSSRPWRRPDIAAPWSPRRSTSAAGWRRCRSCSAGESPPTGVFASNINQAVGAIAGARLAGSARSRPSCRSSATTTTRCASASRCR